MPFIVCKDITDPTSLQAPYFVANTEVANADGSFSYQGGDGKYIGQVPNQYSKFTTDATTIGAYQKWKRDGHILSSCTRFGDRVFVYTIVEFQIYS